MNKNYLYILVVVGYIIFSGCGKKYYNVTLIKTLNNTTEKELYYKVETEVGTNAVYIRQTSIDSVVFYKEGHYTPVIMGHFEPKIRVDKEVIYNLTDTTIFEFITQSYVERSDAELMFFDIRSFDFFTNNTYVEITDAFLQLLPKDYTMLEKFPEYYGN